MNPLAQFLQQGVFASLEEITIVDDNPSGLCASSSATAQAAQSPPLRRVATYPMDASSGKHRQSRRGRKSNGRRVPRKERRSRTPSPPTVPCRWGENSPPLTPTPSMSRWGEGQSQKQRNAPPQRPERSISHTEKEGIQGKAPNQPNRYLVRETVSAPSA